MVKAGWVVVEVETDVLGRRNFCFQPFSIETQCLNHLSLFALIQPRPSLASLVANLNKRQITKASTS